jgi:hypothetical protein
METQCNIVLSLYVFTYVLVSFLSFKITNLSAIFSIMFTGNAAELYAIHLYRRNCGQQGHVFLLFSQEERIKS